MGFRNFEMVMVAAHATNAVSQEYDAAGFLNHTWLLVGAFNSVIQIETSLDGGVNWVPCAIDVNGTNLLTIPGFVSPITVNSMALMKIRWKIITFGSTVPKVYYSGTAPSRGGFDTGLGDTRV